ncbi:MAG: PulJ/GspJ family protein [Gemmatimonadaceae bacterium]
MRMSQHQARRRRGTSLVELVVALTAFGVVASASLRALQSTTRWYERSTLVTEQHAQMDAARQLLTGLPAAMSPRDGDLLVATDSAVVWQATVGIAAICVDAGTSAVVPRSPLSSGVALSSFVSTPQPGDALLVFDDGPTTAPSDDRWERHTITAIHTVTGGCVGGPLADPITDVGTPSWRLDVIPALGGSAGAPTRIVRGQRLALYASAGEWMLGFSESNGVTSWTTIQPAAGPLSRAAPTGSGVELHWLDSLLLPSPAAPTMLRGIIRAPTRRVMRRATGAPVAITDSLGFVTALRNRE